MIIGVAKQDRITGFWFKNLSSWRDILAAQFNEMLHSEPKIPLPTWFSTAHTFIITKEQRNSHRKKLQTNSVFEYYVQTV